MIIKHFFIRDTKKTPIGCVAYTATTSYIEFATSTHNPVDQFDRKRMVAIARDRLDKGSSLVLDNTLNNDNPYEVRRFLRSRLAEDVSFSFAPNRIKKALKLTKQHWDRPSQPRATT